MIRLIAIGGEPAVGKTTIVTRVKDSYPDMKYFTYGLVKGYHSKSANLFIIGIYIGDTFDGTDKLSMAAQPVFIQFMTSLLAKAVLDATVLF